MILCCYQNGKRVLVRDSFMFWPGCGGWFSYGNDFKILRKAKDEQDGYKWVNMMKMRD